MDNDPHAEIFLARALEAVEMAASVRSPVTRAQWMKIAEAYRELAGEPICAAEQRESR